MLFFIVLIPLLPLLISGDWGWWEAWVYAFISIFGFVISRALAARRHPDLIAERARFMQHEDAKSWDKLLAPLVGLGGGLVPLVCRVGCASLTGRLHFQPALEILALVDLPGRLWTGLLCFDRKPLLLRDRADPDRSRPACRLERPLSMAAPPRLRRGALVVLWPRRSFSIRCWAFLPVIILTIALFIRTY